MRYLLDTNVVLRLLDDSHAIPPLVRAKLAAAGVEGWVSVVSLWEVEIKHRIGKLETSAPIVKAGVLASNLRLLPVADTHVLAHAGLAAPGPHRDPFDRMLLAQALHEGLTLVTSDRRLAAYGVPVLPA
ncbi:MAG: type II toxin-antitoxin system VapC family toxin [Acetobacteraceae bacterium]|nr:type II toxin-antitoxin system VapC family toxin [Acetobacteraceae bacterium]